MSSKQRIHETGTEMALSPIWEDGHLRKTWVEAGFTKEMMATYEETEMLIILIGSLHRDQKPIPYPRNTYVYYTPIKSKKVSAVV